MLDAALAGMAHEEVGDRLEEDEGGGPRAPRWETWAQRACPDMAGGMRGDDSDGANENRGANAPATKVGSKRRRPEAKNDGLMDDSSSIHGDVE